MDTFCVVCFIKTRGNKVIKEYSFVPQNWVIGEYVYWPKHGGSKLRENVKSVPDIENWIRYKAILKKSNILTLEDAFLIEDQYLNASSTDMEGESSYAPTIQNIDLNYDEMFNYASSSEAVFENQVVLTVPESTHSPESLVQMISCEPIQSSKEFDAVKSSIEAVKEDQHKIINMLKRISLTVEKLYDISQGEKNSNISPVPEPCLYDSKFVFPIDDIIIITELENDLKMSDFNTFFTKKFQRLIGEGGCGEGFKLGRTLFFAIFSANILNEISWTGISRTPGINQKTSFQSFPNITRIFTSLLKKADNRWDNEKTVILLRDKILKHGHQIKNAALSKMNKSFSSGKPEQNTERDQQSNQINDLLTSQLNTSQTEELIDSQTDQINISQAD